MNLREFCKLKGTNLNRVAEMAQIPPSSLYTISSGKTPVENMGVSMFIKVANALGCTTDELYSALVDCPPIERELSDECKEIIEILENVTDEGKRQIIEYARFVEQNHPKNNLLQRRKNAV